MKITSPIMLAIGMLVIVGGAGIFCSRQPQSKEHIIAAYSTSLEHRSAGQVANAESAAKALDGAVASAGNEFSFNRRVGPWGTDQGYHRAPVSYDGEITLAAGGGVCQLSSTLYGAVLLAGMEILERHRHFWPVNYAKPGLDAAVAYPSIDLRFRNPLPAPVRIKARRSGQRLIVELLSTSSAGTCTIETQRLNSQPPMTLVRRDRRLSSGEVLRANRGQAGQEVAVYRVHYREDGRSERTLISVDNYPVLNRIVKIGY